MERGAYIRDIKSLEDLNNTIEYAGEAMSCIVENVSAYIAGVLDVLERQLDVIKQRLEEAEKILEDAEEDLSSCRSSQEYDEESGEYRPSCNYEAAAVERAMSVVKEWREKYERGVEIVASCKKDIDDYNVSGGCLTPPGGHWLIKIMVENQTPKATENLRSCIEKLEDIISTDVGGFSGSEAGTYNKFIKEDDRQLSSEQKSDVYEAVVEDIKQEQAAVAGVYSIKDANRAMRCPSCGMPLALCRCKHLRNDIHIYK